MDLLEHKGTPMTVGLCARDCS